MNSRIHAKKLINSVESSYLRSQIDSGDNEKAKSALQFLCKLYRSGRHVAPQDRIGLVHSIIGLGMGGGADERAKRWSLNALARVGNQSDSSSAVRAILKETDDPQTNASGIAALCKLYEFDINRILKDYAFDPQLTALSALQHIPAEKLDLSSLPIDVDTASEETLKLSLVVVGLQKSPENLLNPRHSDAEMVKALGRHHDPIVSQYSVWAITENSSLGSRDLGINLKDFESHPPNVRSWILRLLAMEADKHPTSVELIRTGMSDLDVEARRGLATGFRESFLDIYETMIIDWHFKEPDEEVRSLLLEHMILQSAKATTYENATVELYETAPAGGSLRQRMEAASIGTPMYAKFQKINRSHGALGDLFAERPLSMSNTYNINNLNSGAVSFGKGDAINKGGTNIQQTNPQNLQNLRAELDSLVTKINAIESIDPKQKSDLLLSVNTAMSEPNENTIKDVVDNIGRFKTVYEVYEVISPYIPSLLAIASSII